MSVRIRIVTDWDEKYQYVDTIAIHNNMTRYITKSISTQSIVFEIDADTYDERSEIIAWVYDNIPESSIDTTDFEHHLILRLIIYTKESLMAFKLRWL